MRMLCYGDSNTYGYDPRGFFDDRYSEESRWVDILKHRTGWQIQNEGSNGRQIPVRPVQYQHVAELLTRSETNLFAIMLGTNDLLQGHSAQECCCRMEAFIRILQPLCGQIFLIAPPPLKRGAWVTEEKLFSESVKLAEAYQALSRRLGIAFVDAGKWNVELAFDGVHFTEEGHRSFAQGLYAYLRDF